MTGADIYNKPLFNRGDTYDMGYDTRCDMAMALPTSKEVTTLRRQPDGMNYDKGAATSLNGQNPLTARTEAKTQIGHNKRTTSHGIARTGPTGPLRCFVRCFAPVVCFASETARNT